MSRAGLPCIFVPRANAPAFVVPASMPLDELTGSSEVTKDLLRRVQAIEDHLGLSVTEVGHRVAHEVICDKTQPLDQDAAFASLWEAAACLERCTPGPRDAALWARSRVKYLWQTFGPLFDIIQPERGKQSDKALSSFHDKMPGLHFLPNKQTFSAPRPLLLAAMLYCSSVRGAPEDAAFASQYLNVLCSAIAQLSIPGSEIGSAPSDEDDPAAVEDWAFQTVLGIVLAGLLNEANVRETGIWISIAYRLILEHCPPHMDERCRDWQRIFNGVQIVDLEHASLHLSAPSYRSSLHCRRCKYHTGINYIGYHAPSYPFTPVDAAVIRDWARHLDDWLVEFTNSGDDSDPQQRMVVFRQYVLHRLLVLSIYHPARGCNLHSNSITLNEQYELLLSARATLKLSLHDKSIWSNWDIIMITWAALIVTQGIEVGVGEPDDLASIRMHLDMLRESNEPKTSFRDKLASRLEQSLQTVNTPSPAAMGHMTQAAAETEFDCSWQIFDQAIMEQAMDPFWSRPAELQPM
ncbi:fungal transcriptional regulatory protein [Purpureocillium lavendulum]|uniref:Fungal transcriptional regulatory protein n=1 Tax=Purpureocillium lavendulum TaxID=1247861 RepID=A0AB34FD18_9HYPO|nr:fungal transcriptional regulatory protein [Purpureocillium lavendulum]